jgi:hypothetical protein
MSLDASQTARSGETARRASRWELWFWPAAGLGAAGLLLARDPNATGSYGLCPLLATTGLDCPFCGGLRGTHALLQGDVARALDHNLLLPVFLVVVVLLIVSAVRRSVGQAGRTRRWLWWGLGAVTTLFFLARNLPWFPYLDSGL